MNIWLKRRYKYVIDRPIEDVRMIIESENDHPWYQSPRYFSAHMHGDNSFTLTHDFSFTRFHALDRSIAFLNGKLFAENEDRTIIKVRLQPNIMMVLGFYGILILCLCELLGIPTFISDGSKLTAILMLAIDAIFFAILFISTSWLRIKFEKKLGLYLQ